ncbi:DUF1480 family protein [Rouxiella badensis]|uniref:DUF1480 domain-containing protein n=1 Tax=Rouxiella badensis TaxID=1646377 RepID=A0A1X0WDB2_9GAMM|nr:DUF1480 family protein [Rouxiella badensis]MCC3701345.1 YebV family protein [Rouxiella badensis]MCC3717772.1 YebV family protein [Rouxiella badensis]MCC3727284.1 YebV family protein [Rouxiella badensis]MCC3735023.1 YebV family protein [Rouxiella badensis]MCC3739115.1 YebV family protein [Rouxiella badensis]
MGKANVRIGSFEIDDAQHTSPDGQGGDKVHIPCKSDPDLCMQLDGWDENVSVPAVVDGRQSILYKEKYDSQKDEWIMRFE